MRTNKDMANDNHLTAVAVYSFLHNTPNRVDKEFIGNNHPGTSNLT